MKYIGIDPGTHTGIAIWDSTRRAFDQLATLPIHRALALVKGSLAEDEVVVVFEDARKRTWYGSGKAATAKLQGAGSIKRDCSIWEDFCTDNGIRYFAVPPRKGMTKLSDDYFRTLSGWKGKTSNHARDAAMLVIGR